MRLTVEQLIEEANGLAPAERERLLGALVPRVVEAKRHITELRGLGKEIWRGQDAQEYIDRERESRAS